MDDLLEGGWARGDGALDMGWEVKGGLMYPFRHQQQDCASNILHMT